MALTAKQVAKLKKAIRLTKEIAKRDKELKKIKEEFTPLFPCLKTTEKIATEFGSVEHTISRSYSLEPVDAKQAKKYLKGNFNDYIEENTGYKPTALLKNVLKAEEESELKIILQPLVKVEERRSVRFVPLSQ